MPDEYDSARTDSHTSRLAVVGAVHGGAAAGLLGFVALLRVGVVVSVVDAASASTSGERRDCQGCLHFPNIFLFQKNTSG